MQSPEPGGSPSERITDPTGPGLKREISGAQMLWVSVASIVGSGWLFSSLFAAQLAGPASMVSWLIGAAGVACIAFVLAELASMFHTAGGTARYPHYAFGGVVGFSMGWCSWLTGVATAPIEVEAVLQYSTNYLPWLSHEENGVVVLTPVGLVAAAVLLAVFTLLNLWGIRKLSKLSGAIAVWKVGTIALVIIVLLATRFETENFHAAAGFAPFGLEGIIAAISAGGVIFAFTGFEQAVQLGAESKRPGRDVPRAILGALGVVTVLYLGLQVAFIGGLLPGNLAAGWANLSFEGLFGPLAGLATALGLIWLATLLYLDAVVSPASNGLIYITTTSRLSYGMAQNGYIPRIFARVNPKTGVPVFSVVFTVAIGLSCLVPFPGWQTLVGFYTSAMSLAYAGIPLAFAALRRQLPNRPRPFRLKAGGVLAPVAFIVANLIVYWGGWQANSKLFIAVLLGFAIFACCYLFDRSTPKPRLDWRPAQWVLPWLAGLAVLSYLGRFEPPEALLFGLDPLPFGWDMAIVVGWSLVIFRWALAVCPPTAFVKENPTEGETE